MQRRDAEAADEAYTSRDDHAVHGDHGPRIILQQPTLQTVRDKRWKNIAKDTYSTFFAIKDPQLLPGQVDYAKPLQAILHQYLFEPEKLRLPYPNDHFVILQGNCPNKNPLCTKTINFSK